MSVPPPPPPPPGGPPPSLAAAPPAGFPVGFVPPPPAGGPPPFMGAPPLPPGWTEHQAVGGTLYWYHAASGQSTYQRPLPPAIPYPPPDFSVPPPGFPAFPASSSAPSEPVKDKKKRKEKAKEKVAIGATGWTRVRTSEGNTFYMHKARGESVWTVPDEIQDEVAALEAEERAAEDARLAAEAASAQAELDRIRAELAEAKALQAAQASRKRKASPPTAPAAMKAAQRAKVDPPPPAAPAPAAVPKKEEPADDEMDIDALSAMHNPASPPAPEHGEPEEDDNDGSVDGNLGPSGPEDEEAWQRKIAAEMGIEYISPEDREAREKQEKAENKRREAEEQARIKEEAGRSVFGQAPVGGRVEISLDEGKALFKSLLYEKNISPVAPWDFSLPLFINDPRYILLSSMSDRQEVFEEYCRDKARELRQAKQAAAAASGSSEKKDPEEEYRALLKTEVKSTRTKFDDFRRQWKKDRRFFAFGRDDREREKVFKAWLRELGEGKRAAAKKAEEDFLVLLKESPHVNPDSSWRDVKITLEKDPRYDAVGSSSLREELFHKFIQRSGPSAAAGSSSAAAATDEDPAARRAREKKERAAASLREREEQVRLQQRKVGQEMHRSRGLVGREEAEREFGTLLVDTVREHDARWEDCLPMFERDPRFRSQSLSLSDKHRLFGAHIAHIVKKRMAALHALFAANTPSLATAFADVYPKVADDAAVSRLHLSPDALGEEFDRWQRQQNDDARRAFTELLKENAFFTFWAGQKKAEKREKEKGFGMEDEDSGDEGDEGGGKADLTAMAGQIDMREIEGVLRQDRRYRVFDHVPEERERWIRDHMDNMSAPDLSVHLNH